MNQQSVFKKTLVRAPLIVGIVYLLYYALWWSLATGWLPMALGVTFYFIITFIYNLVEILMPVMINLVVPIEILIILFSLVWFHYKEMSKSLFIITLIINIVCILCSAAFLNIYMTGY